MRFDLLLVFDAVSAADFLPQSRPVHPAPNDGAPEKVAPFQLALVELGERALGEMLLEYHLGFWIIYARCKRAEQLARRSMSP